MWFRQLHAIGSTFRLVSWGCTLLRTSQLSTEHYHSSQTSTGQNLRDTQHGNKQQLSLSLRGHRRTNDNTPVSKRHTRRGDMTRSRGRRNAGMFGKMKEFAFPPRRES